MSPWTSWLAAWLGLALPLAVTARAVSAQSPLPGFAASEEVSLVNVEVKAFDSDGKPVTDLRREDFRLYENGSLVPITHFLASASAAAATGDAAGQSPAAADAAAPLHVAVFVDDAHLGTSHRTLALRYVAEFVGTLAESTRVMVASYDGSLNVRAGFAAPRSRVVESLEAEALAAGAGVNGDEDLRQVLESIRYHQQVALDGIRTACGLELLDIARNFAEQKQDEVERTVGALGLLVDTLAAIPGRKAVLLVSDGFPLRAGGEALGYVSLLCDGSGERQGIPYATEANGEPSIPGQMRPDEAALAALGYDATKELEQVTARANAAEVTLYTLQATGMQLLGASDVSQAGRFFTPQFASERRMNYQDPLTALAADTGGRALLERNDYLQALAGIGEDLTYYYSLGFAPAARRSAASTKVRVEIQRPGVRVRYRTRFRLRSRDEDATARVRAALLLDLADNPLVLAMHAAQPAAAAGKSAAGGWRVRLQVPFKALTCLDEGAGRRCLVTVFVGAQRADGSFTPVRSRNLPLYLPAGSAAAAEYVFEVEMPAEPALQRISAVVRDELGGQLSAVSTAVDPLPAKTAEASGR